MRSSIIATASEEGPLASAQLLEQVEVLLLGEIDAPIRRERSVSPRGGRSRGCSRRPSGSPGRWRRSGSRAKVRGRRHVPDPKTELIRETGSDSPAVFTADDPDRFAAELVALADELRGRLPRLAPDLFRALARSQQGQCDERSRCRARIALALARVALDLNDRDEAARDAATAMRQAGQVYAGASAGPWTAAPAPAHVKSDDTSKPVSATL